MTKKSTMTATKLRALLCVGLVVITGLAGGIFYLGRGQLDTLATDVGRAIADANASQNNIEQLKKTERELEANRDVFARTGKVVADSKQYNYQNVIVNDLNVYAQQYGLSITNIDFSSASGTSTTPATPTTPTSPEAGAGAASSGSSVKTVTVNVTLENPVDYDSLLRFVRAIERNLTKMQVASFSVTKSAENPNDVSTNSLTIELHVK